MIQKKTIVIYQFNGHHNVFDKERQLLWRCEAVGVNGRKWSSDIRGWIGSPKKSVAEKDAKRWSEFTGWPIVDLGRATKYDQKAKS